MHTTSSFARTALVLALIAISFDAGAAPPASREREPPEKQKYRTLINDAAAEYDAHHFEEARALFRRAHEMEPSARTWRGIGMAAFELRDYVKSLRALEASLVDSRLPLAGTERDEVQGLAERARVFVGRFVIHLSPKEAELRVDDAPTVLDDGDILMLETGRHVLVASAVDRRSETREITVAGGERRELSINLPPMPLPETRIVDTPHSDGAGSSGPAWWFAGAGALAGGTVGAIFWWRFQSNQLDGCDDAVARGSVCGNRSGLVLRDRLALATAIGSAAGAFALGTIATMKWSERGKKTESSAASLALVCLPTPQQVGCEVGVAF
jgi:hypothetical protein